MMALCDIKGNKLYFEDCEQYIIKKRGFYLSFSFVPRGTYYIT